MAHTWKVAWCSAALLCWGEDPVGFTPSNWHHCYGVVNTCGGVSVNMHIPQHYQSLRNSYITLDTSLRRTCSFGNQMLHHFLSGKVPGKCQQSHWMIVSLGPRHHLADIKTVCNVSLFHFLNSLLKVIILIILNGLWQTGIVVKLHLICPYNIIVIWYDPMTHALWFLYNFIIYSPQEINGCAQSEIMFTSSPARVHRGYVRVAAEYRDNRVLYQ